jgi:hypothetical protein
MGPSAETWPSVRRCRSVSRWSWPKRIAFLAVLASPLAIALWWSWFTRDAYGWDFTGQPATIFYCGRDYLPGSHFSRSQIEAVPNQFGSFPFRQVGQTATGKPIFAQPLPDSVRHQYGDPPLPCDMAVYLKVGADDYIGYGLSGGP